MPPDNLMLLSLKSGSGGVFGSSDFWRLTFSVVPPWCFRFILVLLNKVGHDHWNIHAKSTVEVHIFTKTLLFYVRNIFLCVKYEFNRRPRKQKEFNFICFAPKINVKNQEWTLCRKQYWTSASHDWIFKKCSICETPWFSSTRSRFLPPTTVESGERFLIFSYAISPWYYATIRCADRNFWLQERLKNSSRIFFTYLRESVTT